MNLRIVDLPKKVTLEDVQKALEVSIRNYGGGSREVDLGDFGYHDIDCDNADMNEDVTEDVLNILLGEAE